MGFDFVLLSAELTVFLQHSAVVLKGEDTVIQALSEVTFKVGPSSPAQSARASGGPMCLRSGNWSLRFYRVLHLTPYALLLAGDYTSLPSLLNTAKYENTGMGQGLCRYRHHHTLLVGHKW